VDGSTSSPSHVYVRPGTESDVEFAASLHASAISEGFLSQLGQRFLRLLYRRIVRSEKSFLLVAETEEGAHLGFLAGSVAVGALYRSFIVHDGVIGAITAPNELLSSWRRVLETLRYGRTQHGRSNTAAELLSIAVIPASRGRNVGSKLVEEFMSEVQRRGENVAQVVVGEDNHAARALYERAGFRVAGRFELHSGTPSLCLEVSNWVDRSLPGE